jgi:hypothetical protein
MIITVMGKKLKIILINTSVYMKPHFILMRNSHITDIQVIALLLPKIGVHNKTEAKMLALHPPPFKLCNAPFILNFSFIFGVKSVSHTK